MVGTRSLSSGARSRDPLARPTLRLTLAATPAPNHDHGRDHLQHNRKQQGGPVVATPAAHEADQSGTSAPIVPLIAVNRPMTTVKLAASNSR